MNQETLRQVPGSAYLFRVRLSATRRGARLARLLTERQLDTWGVLFGDATQVVAELASNAVLHGRVPGRDFRLRLKLDPGPGSSLRIEVTDARADRIPRTPDPGATDAESGRGLLLIAAYADRWGVDEAPAGCKTVWAELTVPGRGAP
ncbi:ATP-binding protein [Streptomyces sp. NPDC057474]|uniref:ATP-binding protein n=1 Tax=Streptomyces sp. NPDC057474 TaxID=3346144 RepID=UPI00369EB639